MLSHLYCPVVWDCNNNNVADDGFVYTVSKGVRYALKDGKATVVRQSWNICEAWISKSIIYNGAEYFVTRIESAAFTNCEIVGFVVIPDSVIEIEAYAFRFSGTFILEYLPVKIFCESESQPSGWEENWYDSQHVIYWQMKDWHYVNGEIVILS